MFRFVSFLLACALAALLPLCFSETEEPLNLDDFPGWPAEMDGRPLTQKPIDELELSYLADFPGRVGRFTDGQREWVLRWIPRPTRRLHSLSRCYRGIGFDVEAQTIQRDESGRLWSQFKVSQGDREYLVIERIHDGAGNSWTDTSAWYWSTVTGSGIGPWWAVAAIR